MRDAQNLAHYAGAVNRGKQVWKSRKDHTRRRACLVPAVPWLDQTPEHDAFAATTSRKPETRKPDSRSAAVCREQPDIPASSSQATQVVYTAVILGGLVNGRPGSGIVGDLDLEALWQVFSLPSNFHAGKGRAGAQVDAKSRRLAGLRAGIPGGKDVAIGRALGVALQLRRGRRDGPRERQISRDRRRWIYLGIIVPALHGQCRILPAGLRAIVLDGEMLRSARARPAKKR